MKTIQVAQREIRGGIVSQLIDKNGEFIAGSSQTDEEYGDQQIAYAVYEYADNGTDPTDVKYYDTIEQIKEHYPENEWVWE